MVLELSDDELSDLTAAAVGKKSRDGSEGDEKLRRAIAAVGEDKVKNVGFLSPNRCLVLPGCPGDRLRVFGGLRMGRVGCSVLASLSGLSKFVWKQLFRLLVSPGDDAE